MASLKEIKNRIGSVNSTKKITSAMKMISSSKLVRAQSAINSFLPYEQKLDAILTNVLAADTNYDSVFTQEREVKRVAIVAYSSNSSLCGGFNSNVIKRFLDVYKEYTTQVGVENITVYPIGKKIADALGKRGVKVKVDLNSMVDKPVFEEVQKLAKDLMTKYVSGEIDEIKLVYHHFVSTGVQRLMISQYLPFQLTKNEEEESQNVDYIFEPSKKEILDELIPNVLYSRLFAATLDSAASEHAARMMAMQIATDNAEDLIADLTQLYNKTRQQAVTNELLDIIGGANAVGG